LQLCNALGEVCQKWFFAPPETLLDNSPPKKLFLCGAGQEEVQELKDNLVQKAEGLEVKAEKMRVPVPETKFPLIGPVPSLVLKQV
jgi:hypothetical protein